MAVSLPTAADVRKIRENARKSAVERVAIVRTPALAVLGAADFAVSTVTKAVADARARATAQAEDAQARLSDAQNRIAGLPQKLNADELKKAVDEFRAQAEKSYDEFAARGELALGRIRKQPQVKQAIDAIEQVTEKVDARVDALVDDAHDAAEKALSTVSTQTRSTGEKVAQAAQRFTGQASSNITQATKDAAETVTDIGTKVAEDVAEAGTDIAGEARSSTRRAADRTEPKATAAKATNRTRKPTAK